MNGGFGNGSEATGKSIQLHFGYLVCSAAISACHDNSGNPQIDLLSLSHWKEFSN